MKLLLEQVCLMIVWTETNDLGGQRKLPLLALRKRMHEQLSPCLLFFSEFSANDVYLAFHSSSTFGSFDSS